MPVDIAALTRRNTERWNKAKLTRGPEFTKPAQKAVANKERYLSIARRSGMPDIAWVFIAVSHYRESSFDFSRSLAQGDPWNRVSTHVPAGRGPFSSFEDAAVDALVNCAPYAARLKDWSIGGMLTNLERYNGVGYANKGIPSPYIWSGTDQYQKGKYIRDGVFDAHTVDKQLGCAGLILAMMSLDQTIKFDGSLAQPPKVVPNPKPATEKDGIWLQTSLNLLGAKPPLVLDGIVGPDTRIAIRGFQQKAGLLVDGLVGPATFAALDKALAALPKGSVPASPVTTLEEPAPWWKRLLGWK